MNYWFAETTGLDVVTPLFDYIEVRFCFNATIAITDLDIPRKRGLRGERKPLSTCITSSKAGSLTTRYATLGSPYLSSKHDILTLMI